MGYINKLYSIMKAVNDLLLFPMFIVLVFELSNKSMHMQHNSMGDWLLTGSFFFEWCLGFFLAKDRIKFFVHLPNLLDFISCLPLGTLTKSIRMTRLVRVFKVVRLVTRLNRYHGPAQDFIRLIGIVGATIFAGAYSIEVIEPEMLAKDGGEWSFLSGLWWAWVTISTVGYGDLAPSTPEGRLIAAPLIGIGVGVTGYISAYVMRLMVHQEENEQPSRNDLLRLERKMDRLAQEMNIQDWEPTPSTKEKTSE